MGEPFRVERKDLDFGRWFEEVRTRLDKAYNCVLYSAEEGQVDVICRSSAGGRLKCHLKNGTKLDGCRRISQYFEGLRTDPQSATDEADMSVPEDTVSPSIGKKRRQKTKAKQQAAAAAAGNAAAVAPMCALSHVIPARSMQRAPTASTASQRSRPPPASLGLPAAIPGALQQLRQAEPDSQSPPSRSTSKPMQPDSSSGPTHLLDRLGHTLQSELPASDKQQGRVSIHDRLAQTEELLDALCAVTAAGDLHTGSVSQLPRSSAGGIQRSAQTAGGLSAAAAAHAAMQDEQRQQQQSGKQRLHERIDAAFQNLQATAEKQEGAAAAAAGGSSAGKAVGRKRSHSPNPVVAGEALLARKLLRSTAAVAAGEVAGGMAAAGPSQAASKCAAFKDKLGLRLRLPQSPVAVNASHAAEAAPAVQAVASSTQTQQQPQGLAVPQAASKKWTFEWPARFWLGVGDSHKCHVRFEEGPMRSGVEVPQLLGEAKVDDKLSLYYYCQAPMLDWLQTYSAGPEMEAIYESPAPVMMSEVSDQPWLPGMIQEMLQEQFYLAVSCGGDLHFGPVLQDSGHVVDFSSLSPSELADLPSRVSSTKLGLLMFKPVQDISTPAKYGKLRHDVDDQAVQHLDCAAAPEPHAADHSDVPQQCDPHATRPDLDGITDSMDTSTDLPVTPLHAGLQHGDIGQHGGDVGMPAELPQAEDRGQHDSDMGMQADQQPQQHQQQLDSEGPASAQQQQQQHKHLSVPQQQHHQQQDGTIGHDGNEMEAQAESQQGGDSSQTGGDMGMPADLQQGGDTGQHDSEMEVQADRQHQQQEQQQWQQWQERVSFPPDEELNDVLDTSKAPNAWCNAAAAGHAACEGLRQQQHGPEEPEPPQLQQQQQQQRGRLGREPAQQQQQHQQPRRVTFLPDHELNDVLDTSKAANVWYRAAAAAGVAAYGGLQQQQQGPDLPQPAKQLQQQQQQQQHHDHHHVPHQQQQQQPLNLLQHVLAGGTPQFPLVPGAAHLLQRLKSWGLAGLRLYLDGSSFFSTYSQRNKVDRTKTLVNDLKAHGVLVHTPDSTEEVPAPGALDVVVVSLPNMNKCGIDVGPSKAHITQHLAAGAVVLPEDFLVQLLKLLSSPQDLAQQLDRTDAPLHGILAQALFATGVIILLDRTLLLAYPPGIISYLLWQLQHMCKVMGKEAHVKAYAAREDLQAAADLHQMPRAATADKYRRLLNGKRACGLCRFLKPELISSKAEPAGTHMLRNAKKVAFQYNRPQLHNTTGMQPLRYIMVVTAEPGAEQLTQEQRESVQQLLNNEDGEHKTVIGASLSQAFTFLIAMEEQLPPPPVKEKKKREEDDDANSEEEEHLSDSDEELSETENELE